MSDEFPLGEGATLTTAVFGVPVGGVVQVWTDKSTIWHLHDAAGFTDAAGKGTVGRTRIAPGRYREACLFDESTGTLMLQDRHALEHSEEGFQVGGRVFTAEAPSEVFGEPWEDLANAVFRAAVAAFRRGEVIVVEPGGWETSDERYCLIAGINDDGVDRLILETVPAPTGSEVWPPSDDPKGQTISAPASDEAIEGVGTLAIDAVHRWGLAPWDVTITYVVPGEAFPKKD